MAVSADVIFSGGPVYTADRRGRRLVRATAADGSPATSVAVAGGAIVAVGADGDEAVAGLAGPGTERIDLRGRALLPGFQDAHVHPAFAGVTMVGCNLIGAATLDEAIGRIEAYVAAHQDKEWISGSGWRMEWFERGTPGRQLLDKLTGGTACVPAEQGRPRWLGEHQGHRAGWLRRAHARPGATAGSSASRTAGCRERPTRARPTCSARSCRSRPSTSAWPACCSRSATCTSAGSRAGRTRSSGPTSGRRIRFLSISPRPGPGSSPRACRARCGGTGAGEPTRSTRSAGGARRARQAGSAPNTVKIMQDGVAENGTAALLEPYLDSCGCQTAGRGLSHVDPVELRDARHRAGRTRLPGALPRHRRPGGAGVPGRRGGGQAGQRQQ